MIILLVVLVPIMALAVWGIMVDLKQRRRHAVLASRDIGSAAARAKANADARTVGWTDSGGGSAGSI